MIVQLNKVGASANDVQIQTSCSAIGIKLSSADNTAGNLVLSALMTGDAKISVSLVTPNTGSLVIIQKMSIIHALEIASRQEGFYQYGTREVLGQIQIGNGGSIQLNNSSYLTVSYEGLTAAVSVTLFAIDNPVKVRSFKRTEKYLVNGIRDFNVLDKHTMFFTYSGSLIPGVGIDKVKVQSREASCEYNEDELRIINCACNDLVLTTQAGRNLSGMGFALGYDTLLHLDVMDAYQVTVEPASDDPMTMYVGSVVSL